MSSIFPPPLPFHELNNSFFWADKEQQHCSTAIDKSLKTHLRMLNQPGVSAVGSFSASPMSSEYTENRGNRGPGSAWSFYGSQRENSFGRHGSDGFSSSAFDGALPFAHTPGVDNDFGSQLMASIDAESQGPAVFPAGNAYQHPRGFSELATASTMASGLSEMQQFRFGNNQFAGHAQFDEAPAGHPENTFVPSMSPPPSANGYRSDGLYTSAGMLCHPAFMSMVSSTRPSTPESSESAHDTISCNPNDVSPVSLSVSDAGQFNAPLSSPISGNMYSFGGTAGDFGSSPTPSSIISSPLPSWSSGLSGSGIETLREETYRPGHWPSSTVNRIPPPPPAPERPSTFARSSLDLGACANVSQSAVQPVRQQRAGTGPAPVLLVSPLPSRSVTNDRCAQTVQTQHPLPHLPNPYSGVITKRSRGRRVPRHPSELTNLGKSGKVYTCKVPGCGKLFKRSEHLKRHIRSIHTNEKPFQCEVCSKEFSRHDNLHQHMRVHGSTGSGQVDGGSASSSGGGDASVFKAEPDSDQVKEMDSTLFLSSLSPNRSPTSELGQSQESPRSSTATSSYQSSSSGSANGSRQHHHQHHDHDHHYHHHGRSTRLRERQAKSESAETIHQEDVFLFEVEASSSSRGEVRAGARERERELRMLSLSG